MEAFLSKIRRGGKRTMPENRKTVVGILAPRVGDQDNLGEEAMQELTRLYREGSNVIYQFNSDFRLGMTLGATVLEGGDDAGCARVDMEIIEAVFNDLDKFAPALAFSYDPDDMELAPDGTRVYRNVRNVSVSIVPKKWSVDTRCRFLEVEDGL